MHELNGRALLIWSALALACRTPPPPTPPAEPPPEEQSPYGHEVAPPQATVGVVLFSDTLMSPMWRNESWCNLVRLGRYHGEGEPAYREDPSEGCNVLHVVKAPQRDGSRMYVVFHNADPAIYPYAGPDKPLGPFSLVTSEDVLVPVFSGANVLGPEGALFDHDGEGHVAVAHVIPSSASGSPWTVQWLHIVPVTPEQRPALSVFLGPPFVGFMSEKRHFAWTWQLRQPAEGGPPAIELGPRNEEGTGVAKVEATFRFDPRQGRYVGPAGSAAEGFLRADEDKSCKERWQLTKEWAHAFVRAPQSFTAPLRLRVGHQVQEGRFTAELQWPAPADASPVLAFHVPMAASSTPGMVRRGTG